MFSLLTNRFRSIVFTTAILLIAVSSGNLIAQVKKAVPDTEIKVAELYPKGLTDPNTNITIRFSNDLVSPDSLDKIVKDPPILIKPAIPGVARWIETDKLRFYPERPLNPATEYKIEVKSSKKYINGNKIGDKTKFSFSTNPLRVSNCTWHSIPDNSKKGWARFKITLSFNYKVDLAQIGKRLSIEGKENAVKSDLSFEIENYASGQTDRPFNNMRWSIPKKYYSESVDILTEPIQVLQVDQNYLLKLKNGLGCENCGKSLERDYSRQITLNKYRRFTVRDLRAGVEANKGVIYLSLSSPTSIDEIKDYITISPEIEFDIEQRYRQLAFKGDFLHGQNYEVTLKEGAPATDGAILQNAFSATVKIPDIPSTLKFTTNGIYLPKDGAGLLELETINVDSVSLDIEQIFANNLVYAMTSNYNRSYGYNRTPIDNVGRKLERTVSMLDSRLNEPLITSVDVKSYIGDTTRGIFRVSAGHKGWGRMTEHKLVMLTDLGLMARMSGDFLTVWVNSLSETRPVKNARVKLISKNNQALLEGLTDSQGILTFENISESLKGFEPFLITVEKNDDLSYMKLNECLINTSDFDIKGRPFIASGYEAYLYFDRGIFRPGDTVHVVSITRDMSGQVPPEFPYFLVVRDPSGREFKSFRVNTSDNGMVEIDLPVPDYARTGNYAITARIGDDYEIGRAEFQVEEFMPDKIKTTVAADKDSFNAGDSMKVTVKGKYLFGPPASGHKVSGGLVINSHRFSTKKRPNYIFDDNERKFSRVNINFGDKVLDENGAYEYSIQIPESMTPPSALKGTISAGVSEQGGRLINDYKDIIIHPYQTYVGLRLNFDGYVKPGKPFNVNLIAVNKEGDELALDKARAELYRIVYNSILKKDSRGRYRYASEKKLTLVDTSLVAINPEGTTIQFTAPQNGNYKLVIKDEDGGHSAATTFYASGWGYAPWSMENPDRIEIDFDKEFYEPGDNAIAQVRAPFGGTLFITVEKDKILDYKRYQLDSNTAQINIPILKDYFPNAYLSAFVVKKSGDVDKVSPARAYGVAPLKLSRKQKNLGVVISSPEVVKPGDKVGVEIQLERKGVSKVTLAAIDAGIMQLTDYKTPDPLNYFYGQRQLRLKPYDIYSFIYPEIERAASHLSQPGGLAKLMPMAPDRRHVNPIKSNRVKPVSLWSGMVETDKNGYAKINLVMPEFNGNLILTAVAIQDDLYGAESKEMIVKDKIILQESFPRFLSPNDIVDGLITVFNNTGKDAEITVELECEGPIEIVSEPTKKISLKDNAEGALEFRLKSILKSDNIKFKFSASDGTNSSKIEFELPNRPIQPLLTKSGSGVANKQVGAFIELPSEWVINTDQYIIKTSGLPAVGFARNINYLIKYPHGCLEQTTSKLFPLLYFSGLGKFADSDIINTKGANYYIQEGIVKLSNLMRDDGAFSYWPRGDRIHYWSSIYASHFLLEAQKTGHYVDQNVARKTRQKLNQIAQGKVSEANEAERIYAAYVLAGSGKLKSKIVNYLKEIDPISLLPFSAYQLAGALMLSGDREAALSLIPDQIHPAVFEPETGGTFNSGVRTNAILLDLLNEIDPESASCAVLAKDLMESARIGRWYTTQESAFALMALGKYLSGQSNIDFHGNIYIEGDSTYNIDASDFKLTLDSLINNNVQITVEGDGTCFYYWQASGVPTDNAPKEFERGIKIKKEYLDINGDPIDPYTVKLGDQIICHITAEAVQKRLENVVINDLLPAGLEIENPRLKTTPKLSWLPKPGRDIQFQDMRDDRLLLFTNLPLKRKVEFYYSLRAISKGEFKIPPIAAECMYNPIIAGSSSSGFMKITGDK